VSEAWRRRRVEVARTFDAVADLYRRSFADELDAKPFDGAFLSRMAAAVPAGRTVLEVGAGPGHVGAALARHGVAVVVSDAAAGQLREARALCPGRPLVVADLGALPVADATLGGVLGFYCLIYGPVEDCAGVFADWARALVPGAPVALAVHVGEGTIHADAFAGRPVDMTVWRRDPEVLAAMLEAAGCTVVTRTTRPPYPGEHPTERGYLLALRR